MSFYNPGGGGFGVRSTTQAELSVSVNDLSDFGSRLDLLCILYSRRGNQREWQEVGRTEVVEDIINTQWNRKFTLEYQFEIRQSLKFTIYDYDQKKKKLFPQDLLGSMECTLGELASAPGGKLTRKLQETRKKSRAVMTVRVEELGGNKDDVVLELHGRELEKKDTWGKSDPYIKISKMNQDGSCTLVHKTEVIDNTTRPMWRTMKIPVAKLCNGDYDRRLRFDCFDDDQDSTEGDLIGAFTTSLRSLLNNTKKEYELINEKKRAKKKKYKNSGLIIVNNVKVNKGASFMDYLQSGTHMNFTVAIDFTASNGNPQDPSSLHYRSPDGWNQYIRAIRAVGDIVEDYDTDKMIPALGFGAKIPPTGQVSHEFALNLNPHNPNCAGIEGVIQAYYNCLQSVELFGPMSFAPVIRHVSRIASRSHGGSNYFVLLILTDGVISDMPETKAALVEASSLPMSVIIVGVGDADFSAMRELDGDDRRLRSHVGVAQRDIVQFVPLKRYLHGGDWHTCQLKLAEAVLAEVPTQLLQYMTSNNLNPNQIRSRDSPYPVSEVNKMSIRDRDPRPSKHGSPHHSQGVGPYPPSQTVGPSQGNPGHYPSLGFAHPNPSNPGPYPALGFADNANPGSASFPNPNNPGQYPNVGVVPNANPIITPHPNQMSNSNRSPHQKHKSRVHQSPSHSPHRSPNGRHHHSPSHSHHHSPNSRHYHSPSHSPHGSPSRSSHHSPSHSLHHSPNSSHYHSPSHNPHLSPHSVPYHNPSSVPYQNPSYTPYQNEFHSPDRNRSSSSSSSSGSSSDSDPERYPNRRGPNYRYRREPYQRRSSESHSEDSE